MSSPTPIITPPPKKDKEKERQVASAKSKPGKKKG